MCFIFGVICGNVKSLLSFRHNMEVKVLSSIVKSVVQIDVVTSNVIVATLFATLVTCVVVMSSLITVVETRVVVSSMIVVVAACVVMSSSIIVMVETCVVLSPMVVVVATCVVMSSATKVGVDVAISGVVFATVLCVVSTLNGRNLMC